MVVPLGPGKFYGSSLPRPRIYTDVKFNTDRVDPPVPVTDPFLSWAEEAHWSMGGLSFKRLRLQGRIEGNVNRLRKQREKHAKSQINNSPKLEKVKSSAAASDSPPPAPMVTKRRKYMDLFDEDSDDEISEEAYMGFEKKRSVRKLVGDFDEVAKVGVKTRRGGQDESASGGDPVMKVVEEVNREHSQGRKRSGSVTATKVRTSSRLAKQRSS